MRVAWAAPITAYQRIDVTAQFLRQAALALDLAQGRYNLGLSSIVELTQAQLNLTQAEIENLSAKYDYQTPVRGAAIHHRQSTLDMPKTEPLFYEEQSLRQNGCGF